MEDHIIYEEMDTIKWVFDMETKTFNLLNVPFFFRNAPDNVKHDLIEWIRVRAVDGTAEMPEFATVNIEPEPRKRGRPRKEASE